MKERPILFSAPMVRAILEGRKTQTRRIVKPQPRLAADGFWYPDRREGRDYRHYANEVHLRKGLASDFSRYGQPGDWLWVRESFRLRDPRRVIYRADTYSWEHDEIRAYGARPNFRPSIHMPRWASRITLEVTSVRVERLQDISEEDAREEGCPNPPTFEGVLSNGRDWYRRLWDQINAKCAPWASNPWVWVISFKRLQ